MINLKKQALRGSITPLITPFRDGEVDYGTYASLIERHIKEGGHGIPEAGRRAHYELLELNRAVFCDTNPIPIKYMAKRLGIIPSNEHRLPRVPATPELERRLDALLRSLSLIEQ